MDFPQSFIDTILKTRGAPGLQWLENLDKLIADLSITWQLSDIHCMPNLSYNYVARAVSGQYGPVALKLSIPDRFYRRECLALQHYNGNGVVRLFEFDLEGGALLLEDLKPGRSLKEFFPKDDEHAMSIAADVIKKLLQADRSEMSEEFLTVDAWFSPIFEHTHSEIPREVYARAKSYIQEILAQDEPYYLAHGDLHHGNILESERGWLAIDPKGVFAPKGFDVGAFVRNPMPELLDTAQRGSIIGRRLDQFSDLLSLDRILLMKMSYSQTVLATCWALDDRQSHWKEWLDCAQLIYDH